MSISFITGFLYGSFPVYACCEIVDFGTFSGKTIVEVNSVNKIKYMWR